ncbi:MAG: T9SS type A sorting domain-containing protein, partial [Bacteroidota bacterium]
MGTAGDVEDILYNLSIAPPTVGNYTPEYVKTSIDEGLYSFRGLIPGNYNLIPLKYLQLDSMSFVDFYPKHRVLTVKDNQFMTDSLDSDAGPGAVFTIADINPNDPEVCVGDLPTGEDGQLDMDDANDPFFPDNQYDQTIDFGWVDEPNIEANLDITGVNFPTSEVCGNFNVKLHLCIKNPTEVPLDSIVPILDLRAAYGQAFVATSKPIVTIVDSAFVTDPAGVLVKKSFTGSVDSLTPFINAAYNGDGINNLLTGGDVNTGFFIPGDSVVCIQIEFEINPDFYDAANPWMAQAGVYARAVGFLYENAGAGRTKTPLIDWQPNIDAGVANPRFGQYIEVFDLSDEFDDPTPAIADNILFEGSVIDRGLDDLYITFPIPPSVTGRDKYLDENDKTVMNDSCWLFTEDIAGFDLVNIPLGLDCQALIDPSVFIANHIAECGFDLYPNGSYYRVIIQDEHTGETLWSSDDRIPFDYGMYSDRKLIYKARSVVNHCTIIWGRMNFEDKVAPTASCPADTDISLNTGLQLVCTDIDSVLNNASTWLNPNHPYYTGIATGSDNCGVVYFDGATDVLEVLADCQESADAGYVYARIIRTFLFRDEAGNTVNCRQVINFTRPEIILPVCNIFLNNDVVGDDTDLDPADLIGKYEQPESVPYYFNAQGDRVYLTEETACGFAINFETTAFFTVEDCGYKLERTWSIFDWCYGTGAAYPDYLIKPSEDSTCYDGVTWTGNSYGWTQLIVVGDTLAPIVSIGDFDDDDTITVNGYKGGPVADPLLTTETYDADDVFIFNTSGLECAANFSVTREMFEVEEQGEWCFDLDIIVRQPVLDLDERPIPDSFEFVREPGVEVTGDCEGDYWVVGAPMELSPDRYYFFETRFYDNCGNDTLLYFPFRVVDTEKPNVICDDEIRVTYNNLGQGSLAAVDVDEGTTDNCGKIAWLKVRRPVNDCAEGFRTMLSYVDRNNNSIVDEQDYIDENNNNRPDPLEFFSFDEDGVFMSPLLDEVPFFCCDGDSVKVELWAADKSGNTSNCWQWAVLENRPPLAFELPNNYILPDDADYECTQEEDKVVLVEQGGTHAEGSLTYNAAVALLQGDLFIPLNNTCPGITKQMIITPNLDNCGLGEIYINWILSNDEESYTTREFATITIVGRHDYWVKFPKDHYTNCSTPNPDTVEVSTESCDLLAIAQLPDERFTTSLDPDVCYKIFRTYRVINWCEYDGESLPVIVSRDWDAHNGNGIDCNQNADDEPANGKDAFEPGEYNLNPDNPDGDGTPGDEDIYIIVDVDDLEGTGIVYYDNDSDPTNNSTADLFGDDDVSDIDLVSGWTATEVRDSRVRNDEGYWWAVTLNDRDCDDAGSSGTGLTSGSRWEDRDLTDVGQGTPSQDDDDDRYGSHGFWQYTQHIIVYDEVDPELNIVGEEVYPSLNNTDCAGDVSFEIAAYDLCNGDTTNVVLQVIVDGQNATSKLVDGVYSDRLAQGDHMMIVTARDACGNVATSTIEFAVEDAKGPSPILHEDIVLELSTSTDTADGGGSGFVWATDFVASPIYDCNGQDDTDTNDDLELVTLYSINLVGDSVDVNQSGLKFTCDQVGQSVQVEVHAWDELGNHDFAVVEVIVQDNLGVCDQAAGDGQISGGVATEDNSRVNEVEVSLSGASQAPYMTNATGTYNFTNLLEGFDYTVIPSKDHFHENGITTFDVILLQKHIVGSGLLDSPYKMIAADINKSGDISILDLIQLRKIILGIDTRFSDNTSWRFVDAEYVFPNPSDPFQEIFPEVKNINNLEGAEEANFIAVKIGDLNASAAAYVQPRTNRSFDITAKAETRLLKAGYDYKIDFEAAMLAKIQGYQFSLELNDVELVDMDYGVAQAEHFAIFPQEDLITTSWNNIELDDQRLFSIIIRPENDMALEDALQISSRKTEAEAYNLQGQVMPIGLSLETGGQAGLSDALYQNRPNPFLGETLVRFQLGQGGQISLKVRDVRGRLVKAINGEFAPGYHEVRIKNNELPSAGIYYYTLEAGEFTATK